MGHRLVGVDMIKEYIIYLLYRDDWWEYESGSGHFYPKQFSYDTVCFFGPFFLMSLAFFDWMWENKWTIAKVLDNVIFLQKTLTLFFGRQLK